MGGFVGKVNVHAVLRAAWLRFRRVVAETGTMIRLFAALVLIAALTACVAAAPQEPIVGQRMTSRDFDRIEAISTVSGPDRMANCAAAWPQMSRSQRAAHSEAEFMERCQQATWVMFCEDGYLDILDRDERQAFCASHGAARSYVIWVDG
jgi:hypothetical protein